MRDHTLDGTTTGNNGRSARRWGGREKELVVAVVVFFQFTLPHFTILQSTHLLLITLLVSPVPGSGLKHCLTNTQALRGPSTTMFLYCTFNRSGKEIVHPYRLCSTLI